ncbi:MAG: type IA DNA topoisomerase [Termitinemataceae bacterium]|nr:MAG: type IA DNA topoisomerase [Termitinemataceae bacterium]
MLVLAEKASVAAAFAAVLGCTKKNGYFENDKHCVVFAVGHLLQNYDPQDYDSKYAKWILKDLPIIPDPVKYKICEKTKAQLAVIKKCFAAHKDMPFLLATDAEREGELIGAEILNYVGFKNYANAKRFWVSQALTKDVIINGIKEAKPLSCYAKYKEQGYARQQADWIIGMNLSRFVSVLSGQKLPVGRVQTAVLGAIYEREKQIAAFQKDKYIEVNAVVKAQNQFAVKLVNQQAASGDRQAEKNLSTRFAENDTFIKQVLDDCKIPCDAKITAKECAKKTVLPPQLFNLTGLQKEAHKRFGYTPEQTLDIAQSLYEKHKCLSYPRTPSVVMGDDNAPLIKSIYDKLKDVYADYAQDAQASAITPENKRIFNSAQLQDHHALVPLAAIPAASEAEINVYFLVVQRFFNLLKPPYVYNAIKITAEIKKYMFAGNGIEVLQHGWKKGTNDDDELEQELSSVEQNAAYPVQSIKAEEKFTEPKKHYTYASLLQLMENPREIDAGKLISLGTPATRGGILQKLFTQEYTAQKGKSILITEKGKFLIENLQKDEQLKKIILIPETTRWEEEMQADTKKFLDNIKQYVRDVAASSPLIKVVRRDRPIIGKCPQCGADIYEGQKNYYCGGYKDGCKFVIWKTVAGAEVTAADASALLAGKATRLKKCKKKDGSEFETHFVLENGEIKFKFDKR